MVRDAHVFFLCFPAFGSLLSFPLFFSLGFSVFFFFRVADLLLAFLATLGAMTNAVTAIE